MSDFALISQAIPQVFTLYNMLLIFGGLVLGMVIGCVPGLSVTLGIILMLPLTYTFDDPASAIILLLAVYVGGMYGGSISAITLNTPGTNSAIATTFDGYPLAKKGKVKKALDTSLFASVFGGLFSAVLLLLCASLITKLVANFTSVEYFSLGIMGISLIAGVSGSSLPKSLISGMIGLLMACIGMDAVTGVTRFSFGSATLKYGIDMLPAMIALIALTQVVQKLRDFKVSGGKLDDARKIDKQGITKKEMVSILPACLRSSAIASVLGAMPGVGGGVVHDQKIVAGRHGLGGEIGHIHIREGEKETCNCGGHGCLEQVASATGIAREARRKMAAKPDASVMRAYGDAITAKDVLDAAKAGDALALEVMDTVCYYLGWALATISMTVDPEIFVIGGGVSKAGTFLTDWIDRYYRELTPISENKGEVRLATLGNDAGIYGAARLILD